MFDARYIRKLSFLFHEALFVAALTFLVLYSGDGNFFSPRGLIFLLAGIVIVPIAMRLFNSAIHRGIGLILYKMIGPRKGDDLVNYLKWVGRFILLVQMVFCFSMTFYFYELFF